MPDCAQCTPPNLLIAQRRLVEIITELRSLDGRLGAIRQSVRPTAHLLYVELPGVVEAVQTDLLKDAIETLEALATTTEEAIVERSLEALDLLGRLGCGG